MGSSAAAGVLVSLAEMREAAALLHGVAVRTPLLPLEFVPALPGAQVWLKPEMLQRSGSFKFRGAYTFVSRLSPEARSRGVIAPSSGNHGQAVALAARLIGCRATVVMPENVTRAKKTGAERLGARVVLAGITTADRMERAVEIAGRERLTLVPPYDHRTIVAGQGTAGLEIAEDLPDVGMVLVPVGGGGLSAGVAAAIKSLVPRARVVGVEPEGAPKLTRALEAGRPVRLQTTRSIADGLLPVEIGSIPFEHHREYLDAVVTIPDSDLAGAIRLILDRAKLVVEPSGAITVAALLTGAVSASGPTVAVLSGGNIEYDALRALLGSENA